MIISTVKQGLERQGKILNMSKNLVTHLHIFINMAAYKIGKINSLLIIFIFIISNKIII